MVGGGMAFGVQRLRFFLKLEWSVQLACPTFEGALLVHPPPCAQVFLTRGVGAGYIVSCAKDGLLKVSV